jgi:hypothetical protein
VQPGSVRAIEYEIVANTPAVSVGLTGGTAENPLRHASSIGILRCVDHQGRKLTVVGDGQKVKTLLANGQASDPDGMSLTSQVFPVILPGWR